MARVVVIVYSLGLVLLLVGASGYRTSGAGAVVAALVGLAIYVLGIVLEERSYKADWK